jgi:NTP pyrophosphatase (non-canonical NTP hydrolase)
MEVNEIIALFCKELLNAEAKHGSFPSDPVHAVSIINEEIGELTKACLQFYYGDEKTKEKIKNEAIQVGAMALRFLLDLEKYKNKEELNEK